MTSSTALSIEKVLKPPHPPYGTLDEIELSAPSPSAKLEPENDWSKCLSNINYCTNNIFLNIDARIGEDVWYVYCKGTIYVLDLQCIGRRVKELEEHTIGLSW